MAKPQALVYRGNTGNAGYGFEQVLGHGDGQVNIQGQFTGTGLFPNMVQDPGREPAQVRFAAPAQANTQNGNDSSDEEPNVYNFHVAGNVRGGQRRY